MKKNIKKSCFWIIAALLLISSSALASVYSGNLTTGLNTGIGGVVVSSPIASPGSGTYAAMQNVVLAAAGSTSIKYTTDESDPICSGGIPYNIPIPVSQSLTIKALSCYPGDISSMVAIFDYIINLPIPSPSPTPSPSPSPSPTPTPSGGGGGGGGGSAPTPTPTPTPTPIGGGGLSAEAQKVDVNKDGKIDVMDFNVIMVNWGASDSGNIADLNKDDKVDILDFNALMVFWS